MEACGEKVLIITSKNHCLDEILIEVSQLYEFDGLLKVIRIGNSRKIAESLQNRSLQVIQENIKNDNKYNESPGNLREQKQF